jgi:hypothetical protein
LFSSDRVVLRGIFINIVAVAGIAYELVKISPPRWPLIAGYVVIIGLALFRIVHRGPAPSRDQSSNHSQPSNETTD